MSLASSWRSPDTLTRWLVGLVALALVGSVMALGAVHPEVLLVVSAVATAALVIAQRLAGVTATRRVPRAVPLVLLALAFWSFVQSLPLPIEALRIVAPANADVWARALLPLGEVPTSGAISLDPGASRVEALRFATYAAVVYSSTVLVRRIGGWWVAGLVFGAAVCLAVVHLAHALLGATQVFGLYAPVSPVVARPFGPLLNANNLAGYLNLGAVVGLGLVLRGRRSTMVWLLGAALAIVIAVSLRTGSRGGAIALAVGLLATIALHAARRWRQNVGVRDSWTSLGLLGSALVLAAILIAFAGVDEMQAELASTNMVKVELARVSGELLRDFRWVGVGRGAFESAFGPYRPGQANHVVFTHPENFVLQWASEWGIPVTLTAMAALAWFLRARWKDLRGSSAFVASWLAIGCLLLQNLADLGTEIPAVALAASVLAGVVLGVRRDRPSSARRRSWGRFVPALTGVALAGAFISVALAQHQGVASDRRRLLALYEATAPLDRAGEQRLFAALREAMIQHPAEPYFAVLGAAQTLRSGSGSPLPWLQRALERGPREGRTHLLLAQFLKGRGARSQALLHLRLAVAHDRTLTEPAMSAAAVIVADEKDAAAAVPPGPEGAAALDHLAGMLGVLGRHELQAAVDGMVLERAPASVGPRQRRIDLLLGARERAARGEAPSPLDLAFAAACANDAAGACLAALEADLAVIERASPEVGLILRVRVLRAHGRSEEALDLVERSCATMGQPSTCLGLRLDLAAATPDDERVAEAQRQYVAASCGQADACASAWDHVAAVRQARGDKHAALAAMENATREAPTAQRWSRVSELATAAGMHARAVEALLALQRLRGGADPAVEARLRDARARLVSP